MGCRSSSGTLHPSAEAALEGDRCLDVGLPTVDSFHQEGLAQLTLELCFRLNAGRLADHSCFLLLHTANHHGPLSVL